MTSPGDTRPATRGHHTKTLTDNANQEFSAILESLPGLYLILEPDEFRIIWATDAWLNATMSQRHLIIGRAFLDIIPETPEGSTAELLLSLQKVKQTRQTDIMGIKVQPVFNPHTQQLEERHWSAVHSPVILPDDRLAYIIHRVEDVTDFVKASTAERQESAIREDGLKLIETDILLRSRELQRLNKKLYASEERWRGIFNTTTMGIAFTDLQGRFISVNHAFCHIAGRSEASLNRLDIWPLIQSDFRRRLRRQFRQLRSGEADNLVSEALLLKHPDDTCWVHLNVALQYDSTATPVGLVVMAEDITARKNAESSSRTLADKLATTLENISDAVYLLDNDWNFSYLNSCAERLMQKPRNQLLGRNILAEFPDIENTQGHIEFQRAVDEQIPRRFEIYYEPLKTWFELNVYPSADGLAVYFRSNNERRNLERQLRESQRLEAIGHLTGGIAHDFNNLLTVIIGNASLMGEQAELPAHLRDLTNMIISAANRGAELTQRMLAFARRQTLEPRAINLNALLLETELLLRRTLGDHIKIELKCDPSAKQVLIDPVQMESALLNLALNARDAMPDGGRLHFLTSRLCLTTDSQAPYQGLPAGPYVVLEVRDTGTGIPPETIEKVFEPFFTTKPRGKGTGLGLSTVFGFIKQSGGHVDIHSEYQHGTCVRILLPESTTASDNTYTTDRILHTEGGSETILVVEDDALIRQYATNYLLSLGYTVLSAEHSDRALTILDSATAIDLLFTDVVMSGMNGRQLAEYALKARPTLKVLYTSGFTENAIVHQGRLDDGLHLLNKPYAPHELAHKIRAVLDDKQSSGHKKVT